MAARSCCTTRTAPAAPAPGAPPWRRCPCSPRSCGRVGGRCARSATTWASRADRRPPLPGRGVRVRRVDRGAAPDRGRHGSRRWRPLAGAAGPVGGAAGEPVAGSRCLVRLARRPSWLGAEAAGGLGVVLHAAALRSGPVALVQPLLAGGLVFALALGSWVDRRHPGRPPPRRGRGLAAPALAAAGGLTPFLLSARPAAGTATAPAAGLAALTVGALLVAGLAALRTRP